MPEAKKQLISDIDTIMSEHRILGAMLLRHQEALVGFDFSAALGELEEFSRRLRRHRRVEEDSLMPAYCRLKDLPRNGQPQTILDEHGVIEEQVEGLLTTTRGLSAESSSRRAVVSLIERVARLKDVLKRHVRREESTVLPMLRAHVNGCHDHGHNHCHYREEKGQ